MKKTVLFCVASLAAGAALAWIVLKPASKEAPRSGASSQTVVRANHPATTSAPALSREKRETTGAARHVEELEKFADSLRGKVVVNLGTVREIGGKMAGMMTTRGNLRRLRDIPELSRTDEEKRELQTLERDHAAALGMLPEISGFQDAPEQYAGFYSSLISSASGLDPAGTSRVYDYMKKRGEMMVSAGLNTSKEPDDPAEESLWEKNRDAFNRQTVGGIENLIGPDEAKRIGFTTGFLELMEQDFDAAN